MIGKQKSVDEIIGRSPQGERGKKYLAADVVTALLGRSPQGERG